MPAITPPVSTAPADVHLEPLAMEHLPHVMTWVNDREVMQYFANRQSHITEEEEFRYLQALLASPNDRAYSVFAGDNYVGQCSVNAIYWPARNGRLFIVIRRDAQGHGYGPAAIRALLDIAWRELDLHKVWLIVRRDNRNAQAMYLKLGFDFEGVLKDEYCVAGRYYDMVRMSILRPGGAEVDPSATHP
jgi:diamine N-acetyltransferase